MIEGHGDDTHHYPHLKANFSSNVYEAYNHEGLLKHLMQQFSQIKHYPEPQPYRLEALLAKKHQLSPQSVCVTNGATEAIYLLAQAFARQTSAVWQPTFTEYADACRIHRHRVVSFFIGEQIPEEADIIWLCNPNNPTGEVRRKDFLLSLFERYPQKLFIIDQSYEAFTLEPVLHASEMAEFPNVILIHSLTKRYAIPGLRVGYLTAAPSHITALKQQKMPWSVNTLAIEAGLYVLEHTPEMDLATLLNEKKRVAEALQQTGCIEVWHSDTHFFTARLRVGSARALKEALATESGLLIRDASNFEGLDASFFRIAVQHPDANNELIEKITQWVHTCV